MNFFDDGRGYDKMLAGLQWFALSLTVTCIGAWLVIFILGYVFGIFP